MGRLLDFQQVNIEKLKPYENNAKMHGSSQIEAIANSIKEFGFLSPCVIDRDFNIIAGHGRVMASQKLGLKQVPCVFVEGLTEEQRKAYILADNKLTELGTWNLAIVEEELKEITSIDMGRFGFDIDMQFDDLNVDDDGWYGDERERTNNAYNLGLQDEMSFTDDFWQMPIIRNDKHIPKDLIGFNYALTSKEKDCGVHCFIDDYQFERLWNDPEKYVKILSEYDCFLSPDFSLYMDMTMPTKIWNIYRSRFVGAYYQTQGIKVIPSISWAERETFEFCFKGIPKGSIVATSTIGVKREDGAFRIWTEGMDEMIRQIEPSAILLYGGRVEYDYQGIQVIEFTNKVTERWK